MKEIVIVGALIRNYENKLFLMTSSKWKGYGLPGGKPQLVKSEEIILPPTDRIDGATTFIVKPYYALALSMEIKPNKEVGEYRWYTIEEALRLPLLGPIRKTVEAYSRIFSN